MSRILCPQCLTYDEPQTHQCDPKVIADHRRFWARQTEPATPEERAERNRDLGP